MHIVIRLGVVETRVKLERAGLFILPYFPYQRKVFVFVYVSLTIVTRQRLGKRVPLATNTHAIIEELLGASFSMLSMSYERKVCVTAHLPIVARERLGKHVPAATNTHATIE
jgi:hypothetical protein